MPKEFTYPQVLKMTRWTRMAWVQALRPRSGGGPGSMPESFVRILDRVSERVFVKAPPGLGKDSIFSVEGPCQDGNGWSLPCFSGSTPSSASETFSTFGEGVQVHDREESFNWSRHEFASMIDNCSDRPRVTKLVSDQKLKDR